jgi:hypothetical protein
MPDCGVAIIGIDVIHFALWGSGLLLLYVKKL